MAKECVVGLDIGTTKVCAIIGEVGDDGRIDVVGAATTASSGIRKGVVVDIDEAASAIAHTVAIARAQTEYVVNSVVVGVTGDHIASLNSRGILAITNANREITAEDVQKVHDQARIIVLPPDREIIHAIPRAYTVDGQSGIRYPVGMSGVRLEVETHIVTGAVTLLQNVGKAVHQAGLSVAASVLQPIASAEAVVTPAEKGLGVVLVDIGGGTTDMAIFVDGDIAFSAVIPIAGNHVTRDISIGLRVSLEEAERIKCEYGAAIASDDPAGLDRIEIYGIDGLKREIPRSLVFDIIAPRMEEIFLCVREEIKKSGYYNCLPAGIVLTGGGALQHGVTLFCADITGLPARIGAPRDITGLPGVLQSPMHATGLGLVLYAARYTRPQGSNALAVASQLGQKMGGFMQSLQKFLSRLMGTDIDEEI